MFTYRIWDGAQWSGVTRRRFDGSAWRALAGGSELPPAVTAGYTVKPYAQTVDAPLSTDAPTVTKIAPTYTELTAAGWTRVPYTDISTPGLLATATTNPTTPGTYGKQTISTIGPLDMPYAAEWDMTGAEAGLVLIRTGTIRYRIFVDGKPVTAEAQTWTEAVTANYPYILKFVWGTAATRRVRVEIINAGIVGVDRPAGATITKPAPTAPTLAIYGDSWVEGTLEAGDVRLDAMAWLTGRILDAPTYVNGYGGTGYINGNAATPARHYGAEDRISRVIAAAPKVIVVFGTINDNGVTDKTTVTTAAAALYSRIATDLPGTKVIVVGPESYNNASNTGAANLANRDAVKAAALAAPNVVGFIDPMAEAWVTGTGTTTSPAGNGTADLYHNGANLNHLSKAGNRYYAEKLATAIAALVPA